MGLSSLFDIGKSALITSQAALSVTANNVANVNTPGYSRQSVKLESMSPQLVGGEWIGRGVNIVEIERNYDSFIDTQINNETSSKGMYDAKSSVLNQVEDIFNESEYGLSGAMQDFFNSWNEVAANPEGNVQRISLLESSGALASRFQSMDRRLADLQQNIDREIPGVVDEVNNIIAAISDLNLQITVTNGAPETLDQRDKLINRLSEYVPLNRFEDKMGRVTIIVEGKNVVEPVGYNTLEVQARASDGMYDVIISGTGEPIDLQGSSGGRLKGMIDLRDIDLQNYREQLDTLAYNLAEQVNAEHSTGYGLDGTTGQPFFSPPTTITGAAGSLAVAFSDPNQVAASSNPNEVPGNNVQAQAISDLQSETLSTFGGTTFSDYYRGLVSEVGVDVSAATRERVASESVLFQLETRRDEFAGVSLDEEAVNLVRFQRSYEAAARIISVTESLFETIMNM